MAEKEKVTLQDIANMAGISRNTVSKILNGHYTGSQQIKDRVMELLQESNYKGLGRLMTMEEKPEMKTILLLSPGGLDPNGFFLPLVNEIQKNVESRGYVLMFYGILSEEVERPEIPQVILDRKMDGIVCMEIFQRPFIEKLLKYGIPVVFLEFFYDMWAVPGKYDVVLMNSEYPVYVLTGKLLDQGYQKIGFIGDITHCRGFYERYQGYCRALRDRKVPEMPQYCINYEDSWGYGTEGELRKRLKAMQELPDAFIVANDFIAINVMSILQEWGIRIPQEVQVISFDNIPEAASTRPPLTTVNVDKEALSKNIINCLLQRMAHPKRPRSVIYTDSEIIYGQTTR